MNAKLVMGVSSVLFSMSLSAAGILGGSLNGSKDSSTGSANMSKTTISVIVDGVSTSVESTYNSIDSAARKAGKKVIYVFENPAGSSQDVSDSSGYVFTKSGEILKFVFIDGPSMVIENPKKASTDSSTAVGNSVDSVMEVLVTNGNKIKDKTGKYVTDKYNKDVELVTNGSGEIFTASKDSVSITYDKGKALLQFIVVDSAYDSSRTVSMNLDNSFEHLSAGELKEALEALFVELPKDLFYSAKPGMQSKDDK